MTDDAIQATLEIAGIFEGLGVPHMLGGSLASTIWGEPRFTRDVDFVAAIEGRHVTPLLGALGTAWYANRNDIVEAIALRASFNVIRLRSMVKVDVFVPPEGGLHGSKWGRVRRERIDPESSRRIAVTSPEDIVLQKLDWYRKGGEVSEQQWRDVTSVLRILGSELDHAYLDEWAARMDLVEPLARARGEARG